MAKRGIFGRIRQALHAVFPVIPGRPKKRKPPAEPPERPASPGGTRPPRPPPVPSPPGGGRGAPPRGGNVYESIWNEETLSRAGIKYRRHLEVFESIPGIATDTDQAEREDLWRSYVKHIATGTEKRNDPRNPFWREIGIHPGDFDWDGWRTAMGYKRRR